MDCSNRGKCKSDGKCACYPGYTGQDCELFIPCPSNCTSSKNGICKADSTCSCFEGFQGAACESSGEGGGSSTSTLSSINKTNQSSEMVGCKNNCTNRGICNEVLGVCICESGYFGNNCEKDEKDLVDNETLTGGNLNESTKEEKAKIETTTENHETNHNSEKENNNSKSETEGTPTNKTSSSNETSTSTKSLAQKKDSVALINQNFSIVNSQNSSSTNESSSLVNTTISENSSNNSFTSNNNQTNLNNISNGSNINNGSNGTKSNFSNSSNSSNSSKGFEFKRHGNRSLTAQMFGLADEETALILSSSAENEQNYDVHNCDNDCNYNGLCVNKVCFCRQGVNK